MQLEDLQIRLRPRQPWEAMDLGLVMVQHWWRGSYALWFVVTLPVFLALNVLLDAGLWAMIALWWLKPAFERPLLHFYSRAVFGAQPRVLDTLHALPRLLWRSGLGWHLSLGRVLDLARSYRLPVWQLEGLRGRARRARLRVLGRRDTGHAVGMLLVCLHFEIIISLGLLMLGVLMLPAGPEWHWERLFEGNDGATRWLWNTLAYVGYSVIAPVFVASGFALYLNRRTVLEAWDIELDLRRLALRLDDARRPTGAPLGVIMLGLGVLGVSAGLLGAPAAALAQGTASAADPEHVILEVLAAPEFGTERTVQRWRYRPGDTPASAPSLDPGPFEALGRFLAKVGEVFMWLLAAAAGAALLYYLLRHGAALRARLAGLHRRASQPPPTLHVGGIALDAATLPADVVAAARQHWQAGAPRLALGLLYRGAIVTLIAGGIRLPDSATEEDILRRARPLLSGPAHAALLELIDSWRAMAYAHRAPLDAQFTGLCVAYDQHLRGTAR